MQEPFLHMRRINMLRKDAFITGEYYHVYNRGIDKRVIFKQEKDYERFLMLLYIANSQESFRLDQLINYQHKTFSEVFDVDTGQKLVSIGAWCLMTNHFHLLLKQEVDGGITKFMRKLGVGYSMYFNIKYDRKGALFGGLFKSQLIDVDDNYLRHLFAYIHLNPLEIGFPKWKEEISWTQDEMKDFLESYRYSSYRDHIFSPKRVEARILNIGAFPDYFESAQSFKEFVESYFYYSEDDEESHARTVLA